MHDIAKVLNSTSTAGGAGNYARGTIDTIRANRPQMWTMVWTSEAGAYCDISHYWGPGLDGACRLADSQARRPHQVCFQAEVWTR